MAHVYILLGSKVGNFARAATVCLGRGYLPPQGHPMESGLLPRRMVLLQHEIIVQRPLLSSFLAWFGVPGSIPCHSFQSSVKEREGSQTGSTNIKSQNLGLFGSHHGLASAGRGESGSSERVKRKRRSGAHHTDSILVRGMATSQGIGISAGV